MSKLHYRHVCKNTIESGETIQENLHKIIVDIIAKSLWQARSSSPKGMTQNFPNYFESLRREGPFSDQGLARLN